MIMADCGDSMGYGRVWVGLALWTGGAASGKELLATGSETGRGHTLAVSLAAWESRAAMAREANGAASASRLWDERKLA